MASVARKALHAHKEIRNGLQNTGLGSGGPVRVGAERRNDLEETALSLFTEKGALHKVPLSCSAGCILIK